MRRIFTAAAFVTASIFLTPLHAQLLSTSSTGNETSKQANNKQDWSFYTDHENNMLFVDFEKINVNLSGIAVRDNSGKIVFKDDTVWQLPVNTMYEVDLSKFPKGEYTLELKTFTSVLKKNVAIN